MKKEPIRQCIACREHRPKKELIRVVITPDGEKLLDPTGKMNGRGVYCCNDEKCITKAMKRLPELGGLNES